jgi:hypothetical protein
MASYVSAQFEIDDLTSVASNTFRVVTRSLNQGDVPPQPSPNYFPTQPSELVNFIVIEYLGPTQGENFKRVATLDDFESMEVRPLEVFDVGGVDLVAAGVDVNNVLRIYPQPSELWTSSEYPGSQFSFIISAVETNRVTLFSPIPAFGFGLSWDIRNASGTVLASGGDGATRRQGLPTAPAEFLDSRFNSYVTDAIVALNHKAFIKSGLRALANESTQLRFATERFTAKPL